MLSDEEITALCKVQGWRIEEENRDFMVALGVTVLIKAETLKVIGHSGGHEANGFTALQQAYKRAVENFNDDVHIVAMVDEDFGDFGHFENLQKR